MSIPVHCPNCGFNFTSRALNIENAQNVTLVGNTETCPSCGQMANLQDGTYDFIGTVIAAVRAPGVMREDVKAFQTVVNAAKSGKISDQEAIRQARAINPTFAALLEFANTNSNGLTLLLTILIFLINLYTAYSADSSTEQAHSDLINQTQMISKQTDVILNDNVIKQEIYEALRNILPANEMTTAKKHPGSQNYAPPHRTDHAFPPNRHERRRTSKLAKKSSKR